ncbi:hypothetical protein [Methylophaga sp. OBS4]|uniref:hypothetical protein n=1 Tax=Methylophaga sp. OBS4 TaxID=2991935 RepID=UPI00224C7D9A|nr:hypothetical protein [Methylophaga sp. OBS4]MCX4187290.1 hypothetical protein [Methylophaga sp. OBS4]
MNQIQKADPKARRKAIMTLLGGVLIGTALFFVLEYFIGNINLWLQSHAEFLLSHTYVVFLVMSVLVLPVLLMAAYLIRFANKIIKTRCFPPPNTPVTRDVVILQGKMAVRRGRLIQILSWIILLAACAVPVTVWYIFYSISCVS